MPPQTVRLYASDGGPPRESFHLSNLPHAILNRILSHLDKPTLYQVIRTNRRLFNSGMPHLYRKLILRSRNTRNLAALRRRPFLRDFVHVVIVHEHLIMDTQFMEFVAAEISHLPNLKHLCIKAAFAMFYVNPGRHYVLLADALQARPLRNLQSLEIGLSSDLPWDIGAREVIFTHPSLKSVSITGMKMHDFRTFKSEMARTSPIQYLRLLCCDISPRALRKIMACPEGLRELIFTGGRQHGLPEFTTTAYTSYIQALHQQARTLQKLHIGFWMVQTTPTGAQALDFSPFLNLRDLVLIPSFAPPEDGRGQPVNLAGLSSVTSLPRSLVRFTLMHVFPGAVTVAEEEFIRQLVIIWRAPGRLLPNLRFIVFETPKHFGFQDNYPLPTECVRFEGRVQVTRTRTELVKAWPFACYCCHFDTGVRVVDGVRVGTCPGYHALDGLWRHVNVVLGDNNGGTGQ
ncbi:hypothetical protein BDV18DRAFT_161516 [Aspergillus unguis]